VSDTNDINELLALFERLSRSTSGSLFARRYNALTALLAERDALAAEVAALKAKADPLAEMWRELEEYQPMADANGHGESWRFMCRERTAPAAERAYDVLLPASSSSAYEPWLAALSARWAIEWGETSRRNVREAIAAIRRAKEAKR
jgi:chorismate mutase